MGFLKDLWDGGASSAMKKNEANAAKLKEMLEQQYGYGVGKLMEGLGLLQEGKLNALDNLETAGETATAQILENQAAVLGETKADMAAAGLSGTTVGSNLNAQTAKGTSMALGALQEALGAQKAGIESSFAGQQAGYLSNIADYAMKKVGTAADVTPQYQASGPGLQGALFQAIGMAGGIAGGKALGNYFE